MRGNTAEGQVFCTKDRFPLLDVVLLVFFQRDDIISMELFWLQQSSVRILGL